MYLYFIWCYIINRYIEYLKILKLHICNENSPNPFFHPKKKHGKYYEMYISLTPWLNLTFLIMDKPPWAKRLKQIILTKHQRNPTPFQLCSTFIHSCSVVLLLSLRMCEFAIFYCWCVVPFIQKTYNGKPPSKQRKRYYIFKTHLFHFEVRCFISNSFKVICVYVLLLRVRRCDWHFKLFLLCPKQVPRKTHERIYTIISLEQVYPKNESNLQHINENTYTVKTSDI